jgi:hypothetical protein
MSFIAECTFCNSKVRVPERASGMSVPCPRCGNSFTLAAERPETMAPPEVGVAVKSRHKKQAPLAAMAGPPTPALLASKDAVLKEGQTVSAEYVKQVRQTNQLVGLSPEQEGVKIEGIPAKRRQVNYFGIASLFLGSMALVLAQVPALSFLAIPLSCAGLLGGIIALLVQGTFSRSRAAQWVLSAGGTVVSLAVLIVVCFFADLLDIDPRRTPSQDRPDPDKQLTLGLKEANFKTAGDSEWVDAGKASFQHGAVRVRMLSEERFANFPEPGSRDEQPQPKVYVKQVELKTAKGEVISEEKYLVIYLRLINATGSSRIVYNSWGRSGASGSHTPRLWDSRGKVYRPADLGSGVQVARQLRRSVLLPGKPLADVLVFEAPAEGVDYLRLELPASAFEGAGKLRLQIPASMIEYK